MFQAGPFKEQLASCNIKLCLMLDVSFHPLIARTLENGIYNPLLFRTGTPFGEVLRDRLVDLNERRFLIDDMELVLVGELVVARAKLANGLIMLVHDGRVAVAVAVSRIMVAFKAEQHILPLPARLLEVCRPDRVVAVPGPDQLSVIAENVRSSLSRAMRLARRVRKSGERSHEKVAFFDVRGCRDRDIQTRRRQVWSRFKLPVGRGELEQSGAGAQRPDAFHDGHSH